MSEGQARERCVVVAGDVTIDWNLAHLAQSETGGQVWNADDTVRACWQRGGAMLLADLLTEVVSGPDLSDRQQAAALGEPVADACTLVGPALPNDCRHPEDRRFHHSYAMWETCPHDLKDDPKGKRQVWRGAPLPGHRPGGGGS